MAMLISKLSKFFRRDSNENIAIRLYKSALLLRCHDHNLEHKTEPLRVDIEAICDDLDKMGKSEMQRFVKRSLDAQVHALFEKIQENSDAYFAYHQRSKETAEIMSEEVGYCPYLDDSSVDTNGKGVFLQGRAGAGSVVAIFPGVVHLREYTGKRNYVEENLLPDKNFFLMRRCVCSILCYFNNLCVYFTNTCVLRDDNIMIDARPHIMVSSYASSLLFLLIGNVFNIPRLKVTSLITLMPSATC